MPRFNLKRVIRNLLIAGGLCLFSMPVLVFVLHEQSKSPLPFDSIAWQEDRPARWGLGWPARQRIADGLIAQRTLDGLTRDEVLELLGPPDAGAFSTFGFRYRLGKQRSGFVRIDIEWLLVQFDDTGVVENCRIIYE